MRASEQTAAIPQEIGVPDDVSSLSLLQRLRSINFLRAPYLVYRRAASSYRLFREFMYDWSRMKRYSSAVNYGDNQGKLQALLTMAYHSLEKGLSLPNPRPGFGKQHVQTLISRLDRYVDHCGSDDHCVIALNVLRAYREFNVKNSVVVEGLDQAIESLNRKVECDSVRVGGTKQLRRDEFLAECKRDLQRFFDLRCSVRQYSPEPVAREDIEKAVRMAQKAPSVCNRQSGRVVALTRPEDIKDALAIQKGARGFEGQIKALLVITADLSTFQSAGERYQCWIDGGLFAMSVIYALHSLGLVSCSLNWSKTHGTDMAFRERFQIKQSENIIMLLSVGHPLPEFAVAESWRRPLSEVLTFR